MADKTLTITLQAPAEALDAAIVTYAVAHGWSPKISSQDPAKGEVIVDNPVTALEFSQKALLAHLLGTVSSYNSSQAAQQAAAATAAAAATLADQVTLAAAVD